MITVSGGTEIAVETHSQMKALLTMMQESQQTTLRRPIHTAGIGLHSGKTIRMSLEPSPANTGIVFKRADIENGPILSVNPGAITDSIQCTCLASNRVRITTVEHLLAALFGMGVDNASITLDGEEVPVIDGSALPFTTMLKDCGIRHLSTPRFCLQVLKPVKISEVDRWIEVKPAADLTIDCTVEFDHPYINKQRFFYRHNPTEFQKTIAPARTFGFLKDVTRLRKAGLALGGSLDNAVVLDEHSVLNPDGLRFPDEFVRHKLLDILGDLALLGGNLAASISAYKPGHRLHHALVRKIIGDPKASILAPQTAAEQPFELPIRQPALRAPNLQQI